ncbi:type II toxin -antitoxin system TacA 1-like antitoxin [Cryobacterium sp. CAN_C2]|uniref:type II toxin -antitoxin system TacA 1-like antitoxin n=1 Tax=Cryobacterium sp. CAN_C2 TaxID=2787723 RepID=UPI003FA4BE04
MGRAAAETNWSVSDFVVRIARLEAERVLADRRWFEASAVEGLEFDRLLDEALGDNSLLAQLVRRPSLFAECVYSHDARALRRCAGGATRAQRRRSRGARGAGLLAKPQLPRTGATPAERDRTAPPGDASAAYWRSPRAARHNPVHVCRADPRELGVDPAQRRNRRAARTIHRDAVSVNPWASETPTQFKLRGVGVGLVGQGAAPAQALRGLDRTDHE